MCRRLAATGGWPRLLATTLFGLFAAATQAQTSPASTVGTQSMSPSVVLYRSVFADYRSYAEQPVKPWRESNDTVGLIGGWRVYAKEAREAVPATPSGPAASAAPQPKAGCNHECHHGDRP